MNIHLLRSSEYSPEQYWDVLTLLRSFPGPMEFITTETPVEFHDSELTNATVDPNDFTLLLEVQPPPRSGAPMMKKIAPPERVTKTSWKAMFAHCENARKQNDIVQDDAVVLLTSLDNNKNWFSAADPDGKKNFFVQTSHWDFYMAGDQRFPVAYLVASEILMHHLFDGYKDMLKHVHKKPRGCMMDFCKRKREIILKLRTGDLCGDCLNLIQERKVDFTLARQVMQIMEGIRSNILFKERFPVTLQPSKILIKGRNKKLLLPDLGQMEVRLTPLEKTVYLFFLNHPEGIRIMDMPDYEDELFEIYSSISSASNLDTMKSRIRDLVSQQSNSISEKMSRIKNKFIQKVGTEMAEAYIIQGENAELKRIVLDRSLVEIQ